MKRKTLSAALTALGALMLLAALALVGKNLLEERRAEELSRNALDSLVSVIPTEPPRETNDPVDPLHPSLPAEEDVEYPDYVLNPEMEMPEYVIDNVAYIGWLEIPDLELQLPVISKTTDRDLQKAPCRYSGSAYLNDLVIGAHNYTIHFGGIGNLSYGSAVIFTDMDGNVFRYQVANIEILQPDDVEELCSGEWPLTLYTCTIGGRTRVTVRCELTEE